MNGEYQGEINGTHSMIPIVSDKIKYFGIILENVRIYEVSKEHVGR
jgi:hypothetical protein